MDELDEFNEAPHSLRSEANLRNGIRSERMANIELDDDDDDDQNQISILDRTTPGRIEATDLLSGDEMFPRNTGDVDLLINDTNHIKAPHHQSVAYQLQQQQQQQQFQPHTQATTVLSNLDAFSDSGSSSDIDRHIFNTLNNTGDLDNIRIITNAKKNHQFNRHSNNQNM